MVAHMRVARWLAGANQSSWTSHGKSPVMYVLQGETRPATKVFRVTSLLFVVGVCVYTHTATYEEFMVLWKTIVLPMSSLMY